MKTYFWKKRLLKNIKSDDNDEHNLRFQWFSQKMVFTKFFSFFVRFFGFFSFVFVSVSFFRFFSIRNGPKRCENDPKPSANDPKPSENDPKPSEKVWKPLSFLIRHMYDDMEDDNGLSEYFVHRAIWIEKRENIFLKTRKYFFA